MQTRRRFLQTLAATPAVAAVPALWAMDIPEVPELTKFDAAEYNCGLLWVETDFSVYVHKSVYTWQEWDIFKQKLVTKEFVQLDFALPGQNDFIVHDPKYAIPFTARNGRGFLNITYNDGYEKSAFMRHRRWVLNDMNKLNENNGYHRRLVIA